MRRIVLKVTCALPLALGATLLTLPAAAQQPPNIVLVVSDDQGWDDVGYHNPLVLTPNIDLLAQEGVVLNHFYVAPLCSPTRLSLAMGRHPIRRGLQRRVIQQHDVEGLPRDEQILPEMLAAEGYAPTMTAGKFHMGVAYSKYHPIRQGFDGFYGNYLGQTDYYTHKTAGERDWHLDFESRPEDDGLYHTDLVGAAAASFIEANAQGPDPFFLSVQFLAPHYPMQAPQELIDYYLGEGFEDPRATHLAKVTAMDQAIGAILQAINAQGIRDNTVVWFFSDNGGKNRWGGSNEPLRGQKREMFEGGIRVPAVVRYPNGLPAGALNDSMITVLDVFPTLRGMILEQTGSLEPTLNELDGVDMYGNLQGAAAAPDKTYFVFTSQFDDGEESYAVVTFRDGQMSWKLVWKDRDLFPDPNDHTGVTLLLYDLSADPNEVINLAGQNPSVVDDLVDLLVEWHGLRPTDGSGMSGKLPAPPGWDAPVDWSYFDKPVVCDGSRFVAYRDGSSSVQQIGIVDENAVVTPFASLDGGPDGDQDLVFASLGYHPADGLLYGVRLAPTSLFQIDQNGLVLELGPVSGLAGDERLTAGEVQPDGQRYWAFDDRNDRLYAIGLDNLIAVEVPLSGDVPGGNLRLGDLVFNAAAELVAYDQTSENVLTITTAGVVSTSGFTYPLGTIGALWSDGDGNLVAYKQRTNGSVQGPGLYLLDLVTGSTELIAAGDALTRLDGAGCP